MEKIFRRGNTRRTDDVIFDIFFRQSTLPARCIPFIARIIEDNVSAGSKHPSNTLPSIDDTILLLEQFRNFKFSIYASNPIQGLFF